MCGGVYPEAFSLVSINNHDANHIGIRITVNAEDKRTITGNAQGFN